MGNLEQMKIDWTPVRKREARRLLAWALLLLMPFTVSSCDGALDVSYGYQYFLFFYLGNVYFTVLGTLGIAYLSLGLISIWTESAYTRWSAASIALWHLLLGTILFVIVGDWIYGADGWFQRPVFFPFFGNYGFFYEGEWLWVDAAKTLPDRFNSETNSEAQMLDGITLVVFLGVAWWITQSYSDLRRMLLGAGQ